MIFKKISNYLARKKTKSKLNSIGPVFYIERPYSFIGGNNINVGNNFYAEKNLKLQTWEFYNGEKTGYKPSIIIGDNVSMMSNCHISALDSVKIGDGCLFGDNVFISDNSHGRTNTIDELDLPPLKRKLSSKEQVIIGKNVWIGRNVCILSGVKIGDGCVIGANSVVTHSFGNNCIVAGVPAKIIKQISK